MEYSNNFYDGFRAGFELARRQSYEHNNKTEKRGVWHPCHITGIGRCSNCGFLHAKPVRTSVDYESICPNCGASMFYIYQEWQNGR